MTDKEFKALLSGKPVKWDSGDEAERYIKEYEEKKKGGKKEDLKKKKNLPDEIAKRKAKK